MKSGYIYLNSVKIYIFSSSFCDVNGKDNHFNHFLTTLIKSFDLLYGIYRK